MKLAGIYKKKKKKFERMADRLSGKAGCEKKRTRADPGTLQSSHSHARVQQ